MNRKRRFFDIWNFNFENMFRSFDEDIIALKKVSPSDYEENGPITFGYSIRVGSDTNFQPEVRQWGNFNDYRRKLGLLELPIPLKTPSEPHLPAVSTSNERFVDFLDEDKYLKIIVEVPGFNKEDLDMDIDEDGSEIILKSKSESRELNHIINLPSKIEVKSIKSSVNNGVLEIRGKKTKDSSKKFKMKID